MTDKTTRIEERIQRENKPSFKYLLKLFAYVFGSAKVMCLIFIGLSTLLSLLRPALAFIWGRYIDAAGSLIATQSIIGMAGLLMSYYVIDFLAGLLNQYVNAWEEIERLDVVQRNRFQELVDSKTYRKLASLPSEMFEIPAINDRIERFMKFTTDSWDGVNRKIMVNGYNIVSKTVSVVSIAASLWVLNPMLCWLVLIAPIPTLYTTYVSDKLRFKFVKSSAKEKREADYYEKLMMGAAAKEMKALGLHDFFYEKWKKIIDEYIRKERRTQLISSIFGVCNNLIGSAATTTAIIYAIILMTRGALSLGGLGAAMSLVQTLVNDMGALMSSTGSFLSKKNEAAMFFDVMDLEEQKQAERKVEIGSIEARNLNYRYPLTEKYVLNDVNLTIQKGEHIAFVGENGAGKSTFVRILSGMMAPSNGDLLVNGVPEDEAGRSARYESMASVLQSPARYTTFTVADNVALGDPSKPRDEAAISRALEAAGYSEADQNALLGKDIGGTDLSGGQWQKLSIARAHYRGRDFVLLDEPTGNLDPLAEAEVFQKYMDLAQGKTLIMVTHRISVASLADRIVVFAGGKIVEDGTHDELLEQNGEYARLYHEQAKWYAREQDVALHP